MSDSRRNSFDVLRFFAAYCVFYSHQLSFLGFHEPALGPLGITLASTGLYIFFALSGYLVYGSLARSANIRHYFVARGLRIYPGAIANVVFCIILGACLTNLPLAAFFSSSQTWAYSLHNASIFVTPTQLTLPGVLTSARWPVINGSIWTIKYELLCYVLLFVIYRASRPLGLSKRSAIGGCALMAGCLYVLYISTRPNPPPELFFTHYNLFNLSRFFMTFLFGACIAAMEPHHETAKLIFLSVPAALIGFGPSVEFARCGVILLLTYFVIEIGKSKLLYSPTYSRVGDLSYGFFLYAYPIQNAVNTAFAAQMSFGMLTLLTSALTLLCAFASWRLIERPCLGFKSGGRSNFTLKTHEIPRGEAKRE